MTGRMAAAHCLCPSAQRTRTPTKRYKTSPRHERPEGTDRRAASNAEQNSQRMGVIWKREGNDLFLPAGQMTEDAQSLVWQRPALEYLYYPYEIYAPMKTCGFWKSGSRTDFITVITANCNFSMNLNG